MFVSNKYILYNKNTPILSFQCLRDENNKPYFSIIEQYSEQKPYGFDSISSWIKNRRAPKHRTHIKEIIEKCGCNDLEGYIRFTYAAGLNDTFWVKPDDKDLSWEDVSLYQNEFDENIARIAFDGGLMGNKFSSASPELATDGTFPKCWKRFDEGVFLLKQGSKECPLSPYSEQYAYELAKIICDNPVEYDIVKYHGKLSAKCPLFTSEQISYAPISAILGEDATFDEILSFYEKIGAGDKFRQMILLDALTLNTDRHMKNFGVLYNSDTMEIIDMAPIFDNNLSLCPKASEDDLLNIEQYAKTRTCAFEEGFNEVVYKCMNKSLQNQLISLKDFHFSRNHKYHLPLERLGLLEKMVQYQIDNLMHHRSLNIEYDELSDVRLEDFRIVIDTATIDEYTIEKLLKDDFSIPNFSITTDNNEILTVSNCQFCTNKQKDGSIEIEIYDAVIEEKATNLHVQNLNDLCINLTNSVGYSQIQPKRIEIELGINDNIRTSTIYNCNISININSNIDKKEIQDILSTTSSEKEKISKMIKNTTRSCNF